MKSNQAPKDCRHSMGKAWTREKYENVDVKETSRCMASAGAQEIAPFAYLVP